MAGIFVRLHIEDLGLARGFLRGIGERAEDLRPPLRSAGFHMLDSIRENFRVGGRPEPWVPLSPVTLRRKWPETRILIETERLMRSIRFRASRASLAVGSRIRYARIHQRGGHAGPDRQVFIPARPYLVFQASDMELIGRLVGEYLAGEGG
jgi:phage virion morphogenesis protein